MIRGQRRIKGLAVWDRIATGLHMPDPARAALGLAPSQRTAHAVHPVAPGPSRPPTTRPLATITTVLAQPDHVAAIRSFRAADLQVGGGHLYATVVQYPRPG
ncbi:hypothetical protein [Actinomadura sp. 6N118]|uniref:hypothetical protein n=1 Tax=Actinomadura sp. 6N118 TaxID=3375151 RepID=UPI003788B909